MLSLPQKPPPPRIAVLRMLSRLTVTQLISGIGAILLLVVLLSTVAVVGWQWRGDRIARAELSGLPASAAVMNLARLTAEHRGLSAGMLAGGQAFRAMRASTHAEVELALVVALDATRRWTTPRISRLRDSVDAEWHELSKSVAVEGIAAAAAFQRHTTLVQHELELLDEVVGLSTLALDNEPVAHHLVVAALEQQPRLSEMIGQLRGVGTGILAQRTFAPGDAPLIATMLGNRRRMFDAAMVQLQRTGDADPSVLVALAPHMQRARATFGRATSLIEAELLQTDRPHMAATAYFANVTHALEAQSALARATFAILSARLQARGDAAGRAVWIALAAGGALIALTSFMIWSIIRTVRIDTTWRDAALHAAARNSAFLSAVLDAAPDAVVILDTAGTIELVNAHVEQAFGYRREELLGKPGQLLFPQAALPSAIPGSPAVASAAAGVRAVAVDCGRKDGTRFPVELGVSPMEAAGVNHVIVVGRDVSERHAIERQLQHSQKMESIGQLTGGLAHDFNNLLGVIIGNLDLLERHVEANANAHARVRTAQRAAIRGSELTKHLLAFARRQELDPQPTPVNDVIDELLEMLPRTLGPEIRIATELAADLPSATVDAAGLESALLNLSLNARDAMPGGGRLSLVTALVALDHDYAPVKAGELDAGNYIQIAVSDTGCGIPPDALSKVFEPFFTTKPRGKGTGLGLAMVYGFVKQSHGNIRIYSEVGVGTTFTIYLPLADAGVAARPARVRARSSSTTGGLTGTVLIVDDEVDLLEIAVTYCEELGLHVLHATDGPRALEVADGAAHIDLLLTDIVMPGGLNGVALAAKLRARYPTLKVAYCSGFPSSALAERSHLRVDGPLINKPYQKTSFAETVIAMLATPTTVTEEHAA